ncbi:MAG: DUF5034 domain-containing protein [Bacteroidota bacterium]
MKNIVKKSLIIAVLYYSTILIGCIKNQCNCPIPKTGKFQYNELKAQNIIYHIDGNKSFTTETTLADTIDYKQFGINIQSSYDIVYNKKGNFFNFMNSAYACDCTGDSYTAFDELDSIKLITLSKLNETFPAGSDVSGFLRYMINTNDNKEIKYDMLGNIIYKFNHSYNPKGIINMDLFFQNAGDISNMMSLELIFKFKSGKTMHALCKPIYLKR